MDVGDLMHETLRLAGTTGITTAVIKLPWHVLPIATDETPNGDGIYRTADGESVQEKERARSTDVRRTGP